MKISKQTIIVISLLIIVLIGVLIFLLVNVLDNKEGSEQNFFTDDFNEKYVPLNLKQYNSVNGEIEVTSEIREDILKDDIFYNIVNNYQVIEENDNNVDYIRVINTINALKYTNLLLKNEKNDINIPVINQNNPNYYIKKVDFDVAYEEVNSGIKFNNMFEKLTDVMIYDNLNDLIYIYIPEEGDKEEGYDKKFGIESLKVEGDTYIAIINGYSYDYDITNLEKTLDDEIVQGNYSTIENNNDGNLYFKIKVKFKENVDGKYTKYIVLNKETYIYCNPDNLDYYYIYIEGKDNDKNMYIGKIQTNYFLDGEYINKNDSVLISTEKDLTNFFEKYENIFGRLRLVDNKLVLFEDANINEDVSE